MAGRIREDDIALVRERARIDQVVGEYVQLRSAGGGSLKGLCPFHDEKSPSFNVTPARGYFHCFGCSEGGDVISFVQKIDHLTFTEAVERLAGSFNVQLRYEEGGSSVGHDRAPRTRYVEAHRAAQQFFAEQLSSSAEAQTGRAFLLERGFDRAAVERFGVGYAPKGWDALTGHLRGKGYADAELLTGGLVSQGDRGIYDRFRGRLVWPIHNSVGDVIGFGARKLYDDDGGPKYLNTPETPIYKKSEVLFGIDLAKRDIARRKQAVIVEGYTDVMACHVAGVETAVATCGTSFGADHVRILRRLLMDDNVLRGEVVFTFDGDAAGQKAALRAFTEDQSFVAQLFVAVQPDGLDPCELWQAKGADAVRDLVAGRVPLSEFVIKSTLASYDLETAEGRVAALRSAAPVVARIKDQSLGHAYAVELSGWLGMEPGPVLQVVSEAARTARSGSGSSGSSSNGSGSAATPAPVETPGAVGRPQPGDRGLMVDREALKTALQLPALAGEAFDDIEAVAFGHPAYEAVKRAIEAAGGARGASSANGASGAAAAGEPWVARVIDASANDAVRSVVTELAVEPLRCDGEPDRRYVEMQTARVQERRAAQLAADAKGRLSRIDPTDAEAYDQAFAELFALEQRRRAFFEKANGSD